jgi:hypothetical protein
LPQTTEADADGWQRRLAADAQLFALIEKCRALKAKVDAAEETDLLAGKRYEAMEPAFPAELVATATDLRLFLLRLREGERIVCIHIDDVRSYLSALPEERRDEPANVAATRRRGAEILKAAHDWERATAVAFRESGLLQAEKTMLSICAKQGRLWRRIDATPAQTFLGALAKIEIAAICLDPDLAGISGCAGDRWTVDDLLAGGAADLKRLGFRVRAPALAHEPAPST